LSSRKYHCSSSREGVDLGVVLVRGHDEDFFSGRMKEDVPERADIVVDTQRTSPDPALHLLVVKRPEWPSEECARVRHGSIENCCEEYPGNTSFRRFTVRIPRFLSSVPFRRFEFHSRSGAGEHAVKDATSPERLRHVRLGDVPAVFSKSAVSRIPRCVFFIERDLVVPLLSEGRCCVVPVVWTMILRRFLFRIPKRTPEEAFFLKCAESVTVWNW
jgi:hypothetical protein